MHIYLAKMIFQIICGEGKHIPQFDEQLRIIQAKDEISAFKKAQSIGKLEEDGFLNVAQLPVYWKFINVSELYTLNCHMDGAEVYSRIYEEENADRWIHQVHLKSEKIGNGSIPKPTLLH